MSTLCLGISLQVTYLIMPFLHIKRQTLRRPAYETSTTPTGRTNAHTYCATLTMDILGCASGVPVCCRAMIWANSEWGKQLSHSRWKSDDR